MTHRSSVKTMSLDRTLETFSLCSAACVDLVSGFKGKKMPGQMGGIKRTIQNLEIVRVDAEQNLILVKGAVPGPKKSVVTIKESVKTAK